VYRIASHVLQMSASTVSQASFCLKIYISVSSVKAKAVRGAIHLIHIVTNVLMDTGESFVRKGVMTDVEMAYVTCSMALALVRKDFIKNLEILINVNAVVVRLGVKRVKMTHVVKHADQDCGENFASSHALAAVLTTLVTLKMARVSVSRVTLARHVVKSVLTHVLIQVWKQTKRNVTLQQESVAIVKQVISVVFVTLLVVQCA